MKRELEPTTIEEWRARIAGARQSSVPVYLPGSAPEFLTESLSPEFFASLYPDIKLTVALKLPQMGVPYEAPAASHYRNMQMREFLDLLASGAPCYLSQAPIQMFPGLVRQLRPSGLGVRDIKAVNLWIGGSTRSGLHFDYGDNMFAQAYGKKRVYLIAPKYSRFLYQFPDVPSKSRVDPEAVDLSKFPRFRHCEVLCCELKPGDLLFMPKGWWHFIASEDVSISVNCWHGTSLSRFDFAQFYLAAGPKVALYWLRDFTWYGLLGHTYTRRLFSPTSLGFDAFEKVSKFFAPKARATAK